jgi:hypothetical protein
MKTLYDNTKGLAKEKKCVTVRHHNLLAWAVASASKQHHFDIIIIAIGNYS